LNDRLITVAGLILAFWLAFTLMMPGQRRETVSVPTTEDRGEDGYAALYRWLDASGIPAISWRRTWTDLANSDDIAPAGNILFTTLAHLRAPDAEAIDAIRDWVDTGNTLIVAATLNDTPTWSLARSSDPLPGIESTSGVSVATVADEDGKAFEDDGDPQGALLIIDPVAGHPLMRGIASLQHVTVAPTQFWSPVTEDTDFVLMRAATDRRTGATAIWERLLGNGSIIVIGSSTLLSNRMLGVGDNSKLVSNLLAYRLGQDGSWLFDDRHQGLVDAYDAESFLTDSRFGYSLLFLLAGWFIYMLGSTNRLVPPREQPAVPHQIDFVRATGGLMARKLKAADVADQLLAQWAHELRANEPGVPARDPAHARLWTRLKATPTLETSRLEALQLAYDRIRTGKEKSLVRFYNLLHHARKSTG
jgi:hypothetical protein